MGSIKEKDKRIIDILTHSTSQKLNSDTNFSRNPFFCMVFAKEQEETLFNNIKEMLDDHQLVTMNTIPSMAINLYYSPPFLAQRAQIINDTQVSEDAKVKKVEFNDLLNLAADEPEELMNKYNIRQFKASKSWVFRFMIRHRLSLRKVHYERRGNINDEQIDRYLNKIVEAAIQYGPNKIVNMDETHVQLKELKL